MSNALASAGRPAAELPKASLLDIYLAFMQISLSGFGGALAWARRMIVERRRWLTDEEFAEALGLCQFLPGPNIINLAIFIGLRFQGAVGALAAVAGVLLAPFCMIVVIGALYTQFGHFQVVRGALTGISAAAAGLIVSMALKMAWVYRSRRIAMVVIVLAFLGAGLLQWPLVYVLLGLAPPSVAIAWYMWSRAR